MFTVILPPKEYFPIQILFTWFELKRRCNCHVEMHIALFLSAPVVPFPIRRYWYRGQQSRIHSRAILTPANIQYKNICITVLLLHNQKSIARNIGKDLGAFIYIILNVVSTSHFFSERLSILGYVTCLTLVIIRCNPMREWTQTCQYKEDRAMSQPGTLNWNHRLIKGLIQQINKDGDIRQKPRSNDKSFACKVQGNED